MSHKTASEGQLSYFDAAMENDTIHYLNLTKDMSWLNSRNHQHTDLDGHVVGYWCDISFICDNPSQFAVMCAPNTWKMRNSFRKFHALRNLMFEQAGVTKSEMGKYGRTVRPYLRPDMVEVTVDAGNPTTYAENNVMIPVGCTDAQREWTYTSLASNPGWQDWESIGDIVDDATSRKLALADEWKLTICGQNAVEIQSTVGKVDSYYTAGMIHSYNLDRMEVVTPDAEEVISGPNNPLAALRFQGPASGEVIDIAEDQELEAPPYDVRDRGDSIYEVVAEYARTNAATLIKATVRNVFVPAGILGVAFAPDDEANSKVTIFVDVKGWSLCKDLE